MIRTLRRIFDLPIAFSVALVPVILGGCIESGSDPFDPTELPDKDVPFSIAGLKFPDDSVNARALMTPEANGRVSKFLKKCKTHKSIRLGFIGGSITEGTLLTDLNDRASSVLSRFLKEEYSNLQEVEDLNVALSATGSRYGASRVKDQLLNLSPDIVVIEFAVNDWNDGDDVRLKSTIEGLVRQCLLHDPDMPVILLFTPNARGTNAENLQAEVGRHYSLPMISLLQGIWPLITSGRFVKSDYFIDDPHPTVLGQRVTAQLLHTYLKQQAKLPAGNAGVAVPAPLVTDLFQYAGISAPGNSALSSETPGWERLTRAADHYGPIRYAYKTLGAGPDTLILRTRMREISLGIRMLPSDTSSVRVETTGLPDQTISNAYLFEYTRTFHIFTAPDTALRTMRIIHQGTAPFTIDFVLYAGLVL